VDIKHTQRPRSQLDMAELIRKDKMKAQYRLLLKIRKKLKVYNETLLQLAQLETLESPAKQDLTWLRNWLANKRIKSPHFLRRAELHTWCDMEGLGDLIVIHAPRDPFEQRVNNILISIREFFIGIFYRRRDKQDDVLQAPMDDETNDNSQSTLASNSSGKDHTAIEKKDEKKTNDDDKKSPMRIYRHVFPFTIAASMVAAFLAAIIPVVSILALYFIKNTLKRIFALMGFTVAFALAFKLLFSARTVEVFAATAAFVAVEVVFVGSPLKG